MNAAYSRVCTRAETQNVSRDTCERVRSTLAMCCLCASPPDLRRCIMQIDSLRVHSELFTFASNISKSGANFVLENRENKKLKLFRNFNLRQTR